MSNVSSCLISFIFLMLFLLYIVLMKRLVDGDCGFIKRPYQECVRCNDIKDEKDEFTIKKWKSICDEAKYITGEERIKMYGHPKENFKDIADLWSVYLKTEVKATDVAHLMILMKIARQRGGFKRDNIVDIAGYARNVAQIEGIE